MRFILIKIRDERFTLQKWRATCATDEKLN